MKTKTEMHPARQWFNDVFAVVFTAMFALFGALLAVSLVPGCASSSPGYISVGAVEPAAVRIMDRHDDYVRGDDVLSENERSTYLRSSELLRSVLDEAAPR